MALTVTVIQRYQLASKLLVVATCYCSGSSEAITAREVGMEKIECVLTQTVDDGTQAVVATYEGTSIYIDGTNQKTHLVFMWGY
jgi:outer membrane lipoprotein-sorting protein